MVGVGLRETPEDCLGYVRTHLQKNVVSFEAQ